MIQETKDMITGSIGLVLAIAFVAGVVSTLRNCTKKHNYINKEWKTEIIKKTSFQQKDKFKSCRLYTTQKIVTGKHYGKNKSMIEWKGGCEDFLVEYDVKDNKPNKHWETFSTVLTTYIQRRHIREYRLIDSLGGIWTGSSLSELNEELKTGSRFKKHKYNSLLKKIAPYKRK